MPGFKPGSAAWFRQRADPPDKSALESYESPSILRSPSRSAALRMASSIRESKAPVSTVPSRSGPAIAGLSVIERRIARGRRGSVRRPRPPCRAGCAPGCSWATSARAWRRMSFVARTSLLAGRVDQCQLRGFCGAARSWFKFHSRSRLSSMYNPLAWEFQARRILPARYDSKKSQHIEALPRPTPPDQFRLCALLPFFASCQRFELQLPLRRRWKSIFSFVTRKVALRTRPNAVFPGPEAPDTVWNSKCFLQIGISSKLASRFRFRFRCRAQACPVPLWPHDAVLYRQPEENKDSIAPHLQLFPKCRH